MKIGDKIRNERYGVDGTDIPVGATVGYSCGVDGGTITTEVRLRALKKVLGIPGSDQFLHGQNGPMTILALP